MSADEVAARLAALLGGDVRVENVRRLSAGASRQTWSVDAVRDGQLVPLIVMRDPRGGARAPEADLLRAAAASGVPVPAVVVDDGEYLVVERIDGETIPRKILRDDEFASARPLLAG